MTRSGREKQIGGDRSSEVAEDSITSTALNGEKSVGLVGVFVVAVAAIL